MQLSNITILPYCLVKTTFLLKIVSLELSSRVNENLCLTRKRSHPGSGGPDPVAAAAAAVVVDH